MSIIVRRQRLQSWYWVEDGIKSQLLLNQTVTSLLFSVLSIPLIIDESVSVFLYGSFV